MKEIFMLTNMDMKNYNIEVAIPTIGYNVEKCTLTG